jgi:YHS domain-containing protein
MRKIWIFVALAIVVVSVYWFGVLPRFATISHPASDEQIVENQHEGHDIKMKHDKHTGRAVHHYMEKELGLCPVMPTEKASAEFSHLYKGTTYYFCCAWCIAEFQKSPQKYISRIKEINLETFQYGFSPNPVIVKKGDITRLTITTRDITHGVLIREYNINVPVKKGEKKS